MKLYLDNIIFALQRSGGISVYWSEMLKHILASGTTAQVLEHPEALLNIHRRMLKLPAEIIINDTSIPITVARYLPVLRSCPGADIFHSSYYRTSGQSGLKQIVTVYDFTYELFRSGIRRYAHRRQKQQAILGATGIICISESTKQDLLRLYPTIPAERTRVIHLGVSDVYHPIDGNFALPDNHHWISETKYVIYIGDRSTYKNFDLAIQAVGWLEGCHLVIVGGSPLTGKESKLIKHYLGNRYRHVLGVSEHTLNLIYNYAYCLLYPSIYEGFGLPPLEAMRAGCPVVALNSSSLPEVCGNAALLVNTPETDLFVDRMMTLENAPFRQEMVALGREQAKKFTWDNTCRKTMDFYREVANGFSGNATS
jgi:glycosyltransferase involved in cell wall biosynthesis